jgi:hypothetical protein
LNINSLADIYIGSTDSVLKTLFLNSSLEIFL